MKTMSYVCRRLVEENIDRLPGSFIFNAGRPTYEAIQETFWSCALEIICRLLTGSQWPEEIRVGKDQFALVVDPACWTELEAELGLNEGELRCEVRSILAIQLSGQSISQANPSGSSRTMVERYKARLLGFVLFVCHLERFSREGSPRNFGYSFNEMMKAAREDLGMARVGAFDENQLTREFFDFAAIRIRQSDRLLWIPYHAFIKPLRMRLKSLQTKNPGAVAGGADSILAPRRRPATEAAVVAPTAPIAGERDAAEWRVLLAELNRLRDENDGLRDQSTGDIVVDVLMPLLDCQDIPTRAIQGALDGDADLTRCILHGLLVALHRPTLEFFGDVGRVVELELPHPQYMMDESIRPSSGDISRGRFRIRRRGVRFKGRLLEPARVVPLGV